MEVKTSSSNFSDKKQISFQTDNKNTELEKQLSLKEKKIQSPKSASDWVANEGLTRLMTSVKEITMIDLKSKSFIAKLNHETPRLRREQVVNLVLEFRKLTLVEQLLDELLITEVIYTSTTWRLTSHQLEHTSCNGNSTVSLRMKYF